MSGEDLLIEARDTLMSLLYDVGEHEVFPERCSTDEYSPTVEDGAILIPTKFVKNNQRIFVEVHLNLKSI